MNRLNREQAALLGAYTGVCLGPFEDVHALAEKALGRPIYTHEFANADVWKELRAALSEELLNVCALREEGA